MEVAQEYRGLIEKMILGNKRFSGNEDLLEDFCSETFKRSYFIISSVKNVEYVENYLNKVANSAILGVLKESGRLTKTSSGYQKIKQEMVQFKDNTEVYAEEIIYDIPDPATNIEEKIINKETLEKIAEIIFLIDKKDPEKQYLGLFKLRYIQNKRQTEIADELELSQSEISKRLVEMTQKIHTYINNTED
ncbi:MAG: sigma-70 family RNA polymerase sigma factor [Candidatus Gastranaerophilaceae bacterium]|jgi:RNA polymerase sigma factor (sigma-70 family)